jgi:hypothetical protein
MADTNVKTTHPHRDFSSITQVGLKALGLAQAHQTELDPRLPADLLPGLVADLTALGVVVPAAAQARAQVKVATQMRGAAVGRAIDCVGAVRRAVRDAGAPPEVRRAYGVGMSLDKRRPNAIKTAVGLIVDRLDEHPEDAAAFGIVQSDIDTVKALHAGVEAASTAQAQKRASAPQTTKERNRTANRILAAVRRIRGAGVLAFAQNQAVRGEFAALRVAPQKTGAAKTKAPAQPVAPVAKTPPLPATPVEPAPDTTPAPPPVPVP